MFVKSLYVLSVILVCGGLGTVSAEDAYEPDGTYLDASTITIDGLPQSHSIDPAHDEDWLTFTLSEASVVLIETTGISGDTVVLLYGQDDLINEVAYDDDGGIERFSRIKKLVPAGTYYVKIYEYYDKATISEYFVSVLAYAHPDVVLDGVVDVKDLALLALQWGQTGPNTTDFNLDGTINIADFALLAAHWLENRLPEYMLKIPAGVFAMGDHNDETHNVYLDEFYISKFEVTNQQYCDHLNDALAKNLIEVIDNIVYTVSSGGEAYCATSGANADSQIEYSEGVFSVSLKDGTTDMSDHPMVGVSWFGAVAYCNWLSGQQVFEACYDLTTWERDLTKNGFRLATEAEWEYAARGGQVGYDYPWDSNDINGSNANYASSGDPYETGSKPWTSPVGYYDGYQTPTGLDMANGYGLYDMAGNVWEWCNDWYGTYEDCDPDACDNPVGPAADGDFGRILRGGSWNNGIIYCKVAYRGASSPGMMKNLYGFRVVLDLE